MKTSLLDREIRSRIDSFLSEMSELVRRSALESVHAALGGDGAMTATAAPKKRGPGRPRKVVAAAAAPAAASAPAKGKRVKRSSEDVQASADAFLAYVKANEGQRLEEIAKGMAVSSKELKLPVIKLIGARALRTEGQKRGTKYFAGDAKAAKPGKRGRPSKKA